MTALIVRLPDSVHAKIRELAVRDHISVNQFIASAPAEVIIIPTQWRARDIVAEMAREGIVCQQVLIEHQGRLIDFVGEAHPY